MKSGNSAYECNFLLTPFPIILSLLNTHNVHSKGPQQKYSEKTQCVFFLQLISLNVPVNRHKIQFYCSYESLSTYIFMFFQTCNLFHVMNWKVKLLAFLLKYSASTADLIMECHQSVSSSFKAVTLKQKKCTKCNHDVGILYSHIQQEEPPETFLTVHVFTHRLNATGAVF